MLLEIILLFVSTLFVYNWWAHGYWKRRNVFSLPTVFLFGNFWELIVKHKLSVMFCDMYKKYKKEKMIGFYSFYKPMMFVSDPEIIQKVLVTDFNSFSNNGLEVDKDIDPISGYNPFSAKTVPVWKELRSIQSANQSPLKLKEVVPNMIKIGELMYGYINNKKNQPIPALDIAIRAAVDSAVAHGYGIEPKSFLDSEFTFLKFANVEKLFSATFVTMVAGFLFPLVNRLFRLRMTSKEAEDFFISMTKTNIDYRQSNKITRGDLFDTIIKLNKKKIEQGDKAYSDSEMSAHCATFFMDSTITSSVVLSFILLELANNQDVQEKLRREIFLVGKKSEDFDSDKIHSIAYLQMVFDEALRMHSPVTIVSRLCTKDTLIEGVQISKGTKVFISPLAIHYDPEYYHDPEKFDPERFSEINKESRPKYTFLGFGEGPRICVGLKYATLFVKTTVAFILLKYKILPKDNQSKSLHEIDYFLLSPKPDAAVKFVEL
ncbi:probable cytochrome P450 6a17 [Halyomorpha halys]|uniref:probable cytochrome P450 6a17 n=1 Tax=Halyomorpha halys TaxID=286706 RepID=UPI0006D4D68C|nr:probable cytochrome P450 6a17 [Halyomorpha halys]